MSKFAPIVILLATLSVTASGAAPPPKTPAPTEPPRNAWMERWDRLDRSMRRAVELRPRRRDFPMRYENISDVEVREIQAAAREFVPRSIVNIGTVATGCPCEEGAECTDQVWIVAYNPERSIDLQLSRINKQWSVGLVQRWWRRLDEMRSNRDRFRSYDAYRKAEEELLLEFPSCVQANPLASEADANKPGT